MATSAARMWALVLLVATACSSTSGETGASPMREALVLEGHWCVPERNTEAGDLMRGIPMEETVGRCNWVPDLPHAEANPIPCDPCGFDLDVEATRRARTAGYADACCYDVVTPGRP